MGQFLVPFFHSPFFRYLLTHIVNRAHRGCQPVQPGGKVTDHESLIGSIIAGKGYEEEYRKMLTLDYALDTIHDGYDILARERSISVSLDQQGKKLDDWEL